jgi:magnesium chelatase family protein
MRQLDRQGGANATLAGGDLDRVCMPDAAALKLLREAMSRLALSARAFHRVLKVARTVADLAGRPHVGAGEVAEAIAYRHAGRGAGR